MIGMFKNNRKKNSLNAEMDEDGGGVESASEWNL